MNSPDLQALLGVYRAVLGDVVPKDATAGQIAMALVGQPPAVLKRLDRALAMAGVDQILAAQEPPNADSSLAWAIDDEELIYTAERGAEGRAYLTQLMAKGSTEDGTQTDELGQLKGFLSGSRLCGIFEDISAPTLNNPASRAEIADALKVHGANEVLTDEELAPTSSHVIETTKPAKKVAAKTMSKAKKKSVRLASGRKRARVDVKLNAANTSLRSKFRTSIKDVLKIVAAGETGQATDLFKTAQSVIDSITDKGIFHKNKAARRKSRLAAQTSNQKKAW